MVSSLFLIFPVISGCFMFRMTSKSAEKYFLENNVAAELDIYSIGQRTINYVSIPNPTKPTILFFHGAPGSWSAFKEFLIDTTLVPIAGLVSVDRPGYGYSDFGMSEPSLSEQSKLLRPLLERFADTPNILVGHSLGGPVIAKIAMDFPELVDGLILVAPSIDPDLEPEEDWFRTPMRSPFISWMIPTSFLVTNEEIYFLEEELRKMTEGWQSIKIPVTVIQGGEDMLVHPANADFAERVLINSEDVDLILKEEVNHFIPWNQPELIRSAIIEMIKKKR